MSIDSAGAIAVLLVTDVRLLRDGLVQVLGGTEAVRVVGSAATQAEALAAVHAYAPAVVLLDISSPGAVNIGRAIRAAAPAVGIVAFAADPDTAEQVECVQAGIAGFVPRHGGIHDLVDAVERVARGDAVCSPRVVASIFQRLAALSDVRQTSDQSVTPLSVRERQIVALIDVGLSNKEIAQRLQIGVATVKNHVHHILEKLHVGRRGEAAAHLRDAESRTSSSTIQSGPARTPSPNGRRMP